MTPLGPIPDSCRLDPLDPAGIPFADRAPWLPKHGGTPGSPQLNAADVMLLRAQVNAKIAPACLEAVQRLTSTPAYAFLGRWGTFRFDVLLPRDRVEQRPLPELALEVIALTNEAVANAITSIVDARHEELGAVDRAQVAELELRLLELETLTRVLIDRVLWWRRGIRAVERFARRARREFVLGFRR
ncbi:MAG: hypothetical protein ACJ768_02560 [Gaiellaceae bacterium]